MASRTWTFPTLSEDSIERSSITRTPGMGPSLASLLNSKEGEVPYRAI